MIIPCHCYRTTGGSTYPSGAAMGGGEEGGKESGCSQTKKPRVDLQLILEPGKG